MGLEQQGREMVEGYMSGITVTDAENKVFVSKAREGVKEDLLTAENAYRVLTAPVKKDTQEIGKVSLFINDSQISRKLSRQIIAKILEVLVLIAALSLILFWLMRKFVIQPLDPVCRHLEEVANGDLSQKFTIAAHDEIGMVAINCNKLVDKLRVLITNIGGKSNDVKIASEKLAASSNGIAVTSKKVSQKSSLVADTTQEATASVNSIAAGAEQSSTAVNAAAASVEEMSASFNEVAKNCQNELKIAEDARREAKSTMDTMTELDKTTKEISKIVDLIKSIADQTNLLALNATIEAASAGEAGKGFAVVAAEVKELAKQTSSATEEIVKQIDDIQKRASDANSAIEKISTIIANVYTISQTIASAVEEQSATVNELSNNISGTGAAAREIAGNVQLTASRLSGASQNIREVDVSMKETVISVSEINDNANRLKALANDLDEMIRVFKV